MSVCVCCVSEKSERERDFDKIFFFDFFKRIVVSLHTVIHNQSSILRGEKREFRHR